jgi:hypothetical protein
VFATSIWVLGLLPALGLDGLIPSKWRNTNSADSIPRMEIPALFLTGLLILFICIGPVIAYHPNSAFTATAETPVCAPDQTQVLLAYHPQSIVTIEREDTFFLDGRSRYHQGRFMRNLHDIVSLEYLEDFGQFDAPFSILPSLIEDNDDLVFLVLPPDALPDQPGEYLACARKVGEMNVYAFSVWKTP